MRTARFQIQAAARHIPTARYPMKRAREDWWSFPMCPTVRFRKRAAQHNRRFRSFPDIRVQRNCPPTNYRKKRNCPSCPNCPQMSFRAGKLLLTCLMKSVPRKLTKSLKSCLKWIVRRRRQLYLYRDFRSFVPPPLSTPQTRKAPQQRTKRHKIYFSFLCSPKNILSYNHKYYNITVPQSQAVLRYIYAEKRFFRQNFTNRFICKYCRNK